MTKSGKTATKPKQQKSENNKLKKANVNVRRPHMFVHHVCDVLMFWPFDPVSEAPLAWEKSNVVLNGSLAPQKAEGCGEHNGSPESSNVVFK